MHKMQNFPAHPSQFTIPRMGTDDLDGSESPDPDISDLHYVYPIQPLQQPHRNSYVFNGALHRDQLINSQTIISSLGDYVAADMHNRKKAESLKYRIVVESENIIRKYGEFVMKVLHILLSNNTDYRLVQMQTLHMSPISNSSILMPGVKDSNDLIGIFTAFHQYTSWFNYELIKIVAENFGGAVGKAAVVEYEALLKQFTNRFIFECPLFMSSTIPPNYDGFTMKIDENYFTSPAQKLTLIKARILKLTNIEPHRLILRSVEEGCIRTTWWIPSTYIPTILSKLTGQNQQLVKMKLKAFFIAGKDFDVHTTRSYNRSLSLRDIDASYISANLSQDSSINTEGRNSIGSTVISTSTSYSSSHTFNDFRFRSFRRSKRTKSQSSVNSSACTVSHLDSHCDSIASDLRFRPFRRSKRTKSESSVNSSAYTVSHLDSHFDSTNIPQMQSETTNKKPKKRGVIKRIKKFLLHKGKTSNDPKHSSENPLTDDSEESAVEDMTESANYSNEEDKHFEQEEEPPLVEEPVTVPCIVEINTSEENFDMISSTSKTSLDNEEEYSIDKKQYIAAKGGIERKITPTGLSPSHSDFDLRKRNRSGLTAEEFHEKRNTIFDLPKEGSRRNLIEGFEQTSKQRSHQSSDTGFWSRDNLRFSYISDEQSSRFSQEIDELSDDHDYEDDYDYEDQLIITEKKCSFNNQKVADDYQL